MCLHDLQSIAAPCPGSRAGPCSTATVLQYITPAVLQYSTSTAGRGTGAARAAVGAGCSGRLQDTAQHLNPHLQHSTGWRAGGWTQIEPLLQVYSKSNLNNYH